MNYFLSDFEAASAPFTSSSHASTSTGLLVLGMSNGDISMESGGEEKDEEEGVVHWQGSQTSSVLDSLLRSGRAGKGKAMKSKSSAASDPSNPFNTSANSSFSFDFAADASGSNATTAFSSNASRNAPPRSRPSALVAQTRRHTSSSTLSASSSKPSTTSSHTTLAKPHFDLIADFPKIVKQATYQVDEDLKQKTSSLSRSNSANRLCLDGSEKHQRTRKPVSMSNVHAKPRRASPLHGTRSKGMERAVSESTIVTFGSGREHGTGEVVKGKGKGRLRDESDLSSNACGPSALGTEVDRDSKRAKLDGAQDMRLEEVGRESKGRRDMPPPALPPERVARPQVTVKALPPFSPTSSTATLPPVVNAHPTPVVTSTVNNARQPAQIPTKPPASIVSRPIPQHHYPPPSQHQPTPSQAPVAPAAAPHRSPPQAQPLAQPPTRSHAIPNTTTNQSYPPRPPQVPILAHAPAPAQSRAPIPSQAPAPAPLSSQAYPALPSQAGPPRPSQSSRHPPALGMRRVNTFSSSGSQKSYGGFAFASQNPTGSGASGQGYKSAYTGAPGHGNKSTYTGATGLPTKQKPFRPPLKPRRTSTFSLLEGFDFAKGEPAPGKATAEKDAVSASASAAVDKRLVEKTTPLAAVNLQSAPSNAAFASAFKAKACKGSGSGGRGTLVPECLSASTSTSSSDTLSSRGETPPPATADNSSSTSAATSPVTLGPITTTTTTTAAAASATAVPGSQDEDELLWDDPNDSSFGDLEWDLDIDAAVAETGMLF